MDLSDVAHLAPSAALASAGGPIRRSATATDRRVARARVLFATVEPDATTQGLLRHLRREPFDVAVCHPNQVVSALAEQAWDVLAIDAQASSGDALALTLDVRRSSPATTLPILIIATRVQLGTSAPALEAGANDWIAQPVQRGEVARRLSNLAGLGQLSRRHAAEQIRSRSEIAWRTSRLDALIETGMMMSMERDRGKLLRRLLDEGRRLLHCDGATMYMVTDEKTLRFELRTRDDALPSTQIPLFDATTGLPNENYVSVHTAVRNCSVLIDDVYSETRFDLSGTRAFDTASGYRTVSMVTVPISPRGGEAVGVLQFMNAIDPTTEQVVPFDRDAVGLVEALAAQAAVTLDNLALVESQKQLMESMIRVLATAIDAKSPYTGRHCERVPELALSLAQAACDATDGPLADFRFHSDEEWQEFRIGAWLHDCGKVTTPEYVIDKATKLETIHNRIHEVRMRFEVLGRDLEIAKLQSQLLGTWDDAEDASHRAAVERLADDFRFIARCNIGSEAMDLADVARLNRIGATPWVRHFDDRLGLSDGELERCAGEEARPTPCIEPLLSDRQRHIVPRGVEDELDPAFGFRMDVPEHLYNHGELYNLGIRSGTLAPEERYKINEHMVHTIMMLERMPFPKHLKRVPEYAGTHHERIDGRGYPRRLGAKDLSVPARIMAVADIFEALTASDRPYKQPKKLSEALAVLRKMAGQHIDPAIFNLFLRSGVFLTFAAKHLRPEQIDVADGTPFLVADADE